MAEETSVGTLSMGSGRKRLQPMASKRYRLSDAECVDILRRIRWPERVVCLHCGSGDVILVERTYREAFGRWQCRTCRGFFFETTGSELGHSFLPIHTLFHVLECLADGESADDTESEVGLPRWSVRTLGPKLLACPVSRAVQQELLARRDGQAANGQGAGQQAVGAGDARARRLVPVGVEPTPPEPVRPDEARRELQAKLDRYYAGRILATPVPDARC